MASEFRSMDPTREGLFTPSSEPTTGRLIDFKMVKKGLLTVLLDAETATLRSSHLASGCRPRP